MDGGTTGGELIELERNSESEDGHQAPIQIQELTLDIKAEEDNLLNQAMLLIPEEADQSIVP